tara:strand:+ start:357 stop:731 length:375 start_codon:yes stop_codon:yes gene_type:complete
MVEIVEQLLEPIRLSAGDDIVLGDIISLSYDDAGVSCALSNSRNPFGMVVGPSNRWGMVPVLCGMAIVKVSNYDISETYDAGDLLYSNETGQLTNKKCQDNSLLLGHVLEPPSDENPSMEINWI